MDFEQAMKNLQKTAAGRHKRRTGFTTTFTVF